MPKKRKLSYEQEDKVYLTIVLEMLAIICFSSTKNDWNAQEAIWSGTFNLDFLSLIIWSRMFWLSVT